MKNKKFVYIALILSIPLTLYRLYDEYGRIGVKEAIIALGAAIIGLIIYLIVSRIMNKKENS